MVTLFQSGFIYQSFNQLDEFYWSWLKSIRVKNCVKYCCKTFVAMFGATRYYIISDVRVVISFFRCRARVTTGPARTRQAATPNTTQTNEIWLGFKIHSNQVLNKNWVTKFHGNESRAKKSLGLFFIIFETVTRGSWS